MQKLALPLALALMVGLLAGFGLALLITGDPAPDLATPETSARSKPAQDETPQAVAPREKEPQNSSAKSAPAVKTEDPKDTLKGVHERADAGITPERRKVLERAFAVSGVEGLITGIVNYADGSPAVGAEVIASAKFDADLPIAGERAKILSKPSEKAPSTFFGDGRPEFQGAMEFTQASMRRAITDSQGRFTIKELYYLPYSIVAYAKGAIPTVYSDGQGATLPGDDISITLKARNEVRLDLRLPDGSAPKLAYVNATIPGDRRSKEVYTLWTPDDPALVAVSFPFAISAIDSEGKFRSVSQEVTQADAASGAYTLNLVEATGLMVRVTRDESPFGLRAACQYYILPDGKRLTGLDFGGRDIARQRVDPSTGMLRVDTLGVGNYVLFGIRGEKVLVERPFSIVDGKMLDLSVHEPAPSPEEIIEVEISGIENLELKQIRFSIHTQSPGSNSTSGVPHSFQDGRCYVLLNQWGGYRGSSSEEGPRGAEGAENVAPTRTILLQISGYPELQQPFTLGSTSVVRFSVEEPATLRVVLKGLDSSNEGHREGSLGVRFLDPAENSTRRMNLEEAMRANGVLYFEGLKPGVSELQLGLGRFGKQRRHYPITLMAGANEIEIEIPKVYKMTINLPVDAKRNSASVALYVGEQRLESEWAHLKPEQPTPVELGPQLAGEYRIEVTINNEKRSMTFVHGDDLPRDFVSYD